MTLFSSWVGAFLRGVGLFKGGGAIRGFTVCFLTGRKLHNSWCLGKVINVIFRDDESGYVFILISRLFWPFILCDGYMIFNIYKWRHLMLTTDKKTC